MGDTALNGRQPLSVVVKMDVEGAEWPVLNAMTAEDHSKILLFDLEIHWCRGFDKYSYVPPHMYTHATHTHVYTHTRTYIHTHAHSYPHVYVAHCRPLNYADVTTHFLLSLFFFFLEKVRSTNRFSTATCTLRNERNRKAQEILRLCRQKNVAKPRD